MDHRLRFACSVFGLVAAWAIALWIVLEVVLATASISSAPLNEWVLAILADPDVERLVTIFVRFLERLMGTIGVSLALLVFGPLRRGEPWAKPVVIVLSLGLLVAQLFTWISLGNPPYAIAVVCVLLALVVIATFLLMGRTAEDSSGAGS
jgi:hypothetical protein